MSFASLFLLLSSSLHSSISTPLSCPFSPLISIPSISVLLFWSCVYSSLLISRLLDSNVLQVSLFTVISSTVSACSLLTYFLSSFLFLLSSLRCLSLLCSYPPSPTISSTTFIFFSLPFNSFHHEFMESNSSHVSPKKADIKH